MSLAVMALAWEARLPITEKLVLLALADNASDEGHCFPSITTLVRKCGAAERTIYKTIDRLESLGHLTRHVRKGRSTVYDVHPCTTCTPAPHAPLHEVQDTPAPRAPPPLHHVHPQRREDSSLEPSVEPSSNRQSARKRASNETATRLSADFVLSPERRTVAVIEHLDPDRTFAKFCDYWRSKSGSQARKLDWDAVWRNWCRTEADRGGGRAIAEPERTWRPENEAA